MSTTTIYKAWAVAAMALLLSFSSTASRAQSFRGGIRGSILDAHSLPVAGAKVTARNLGTSETREVTSDSDGTYMFLELPAGEYEVSSIAPGFQEVHANHVTVNVGAETVVNMTLAKPTKNQESVVVTENIPLIDTASTTLSQVVDRQLVQELPLNGRDFTKLVALSPGVTVEGSGVAGSEKGFGPFNINGNRDRSNNYTLDGTDNNDPWFNNSALNQVGISGAPATLLPLDAIQEFNLQANFKAEYGRNSGSVVNILTRSGSNFVHGSLYEYLRNSYFDARNFFNTTPSKKSPFINNNFGGSLGGPLRRDKTFFFLAYEGQRERVGSDFVTSVPTTAQKNAARALALATKPGINPAPLDKLLSFYPQSATGTISTVVKDQNNNDNLIFKIDQKVSSIHSFAARYAFGRDNQVFPFGSSSGSGSGSRLPAFAQVSPTRVQVFLASWLSVFDSARLNEIRFGYSRFRNSFGSADDKLNIADPNVAGLNVGTGKLGLPEIDFSGLIENLGATAFSVPRGRVSQSFQVLDNFTWSNGRHTWKFGGEFRRAAVNAFNDNLQRGLIGFATTGLSTDPVVDVLANYYLGNAITFSFSTEAFSGFTRRTTFNNGLSFFAQDDFRVTSKIMLNLGLRWEYFSPLSEKHNLLTNLVDGKLVRVGSPALPTLYRRDLNNFGPRVGIAWTPYRNTTVCASYGIYYDYIPQHLMIANFNPSAGIATNPDPANPVPSIPLSFNPNAWNGSLPRGGFTPATPPFPVFDVDRNLRTPYVQTWTLNLQQQVGGSFALEAGSSGSKATKLVRLYDLNQNGTNPNYGEIDFFSAGTASTYHAGQLTARFQNLHHFSGFSTYTYSKSLDGASDGINFNFATVALPQDSANLKAEKGPSIFDTRHRLTSAINYQLPRFSAIGEPLGAGWQLNSILTVQSGRPIDIVTGNGINGRQRPNVVAGQPFILPNWNPSTGYLNPLAFADPAGNFGNLGRDRVYGPGFWNTDFSVSKSTRLRENMALQFRVEIFNIFNHPNFALPSNFITPGIDSTGKPKPLPPPSASNNFCNSVPTCFPAGFITQTPDVAQGNPGLGGGGPRVLQFGLRLEF